MTFDDDLIRLAVAGIINSIENLCAAHAFALIGGEELKDAPFTTRKRQGMAANEGVAAIGDGHDGGPVLWRSQLFLAPSPDRAGACKQFAQMYGQANRIIETRVKEFDDIVCGSPCADRKQRRFQHGANRLDESVGTRGFVEDHGFNATPRRHVEGDKPWREFGRSKDHRIRHVALSCGERKRPLDPGFLHDNDHLKIRSAMDRMEWRSRT